MDSLSACSTSYFGPSALHPNLNTTSESDLLLDIVQQTVDAEDKHDMRLFRQ